MQSVRLALVFVLLRRVLTWFGPWVRVGDRETGGAVAEATALQSFLV